MILKKYVKSLAYAIAGISFAFRSQFNMRFHVVAAVVVLVTSAILKISPVEWCIILLCIGSVIAAELINTSLEMSVDLITQERNEKAGQIKDVAASAVLSICIISAVIGLIIFIPKIAILF